MELCANTVSLVFTNDSVSAALAVLLDRMSDVADPVARNCGVNAGHKGFPGGVTHFADLRVYIANEKRVGIVSIVPVNFSTEVDRDDVAVFQDALLARDPVDDLVVYGYACSGGEIIESQEVGFGPLRLYEIIGYLVQLPGGDAGPRLS